MRSDVGAAGKHGDEPTGLRVDGGDVEQRREASAGTPARPATVTQRRPSWALTDRPETAHQPSSPAPTRVSNTRPGTTDTTRGTTGSGTNARLARRDDRFDTPAGPAPTAFRATTENVYATPFVNPLNIADVPDTTWTHHPAQHRHRVGNNRRTTIRDWEAQDTDALTIACYGAHAGVGALGTADDFDGITGVDGGDAGTGCERVHCTNCERVALAIR